MPLPPLPGQPGVGPAGVGPGVGPAVPLPAPNEAPYTYWASAEYLLWRIADPLLPSSASAMPSGLLAVTTSITQQPPPAAPAPASVFQTTLLPLGTSGTGSPGNVANMGEHMGSRIRMGWWFDDNHDLGVEASFFMLNNLTDDFATVFSNLGNVNGAYAINTGLSSTVVVTTTTGTGTSSATLTMNYVNPVILGGTSSGALTGFIRDQMLGAELMARANAAYFGPAKIDFVVGGRYLYFGEDYELNDNYTVNLTSVSAATVVPGLPTTIAVGTYDRIIAHNNFYGGQAGFDAETDLGNLYLDARVVCALGANEESVNITALSTSPAGIVLGGSNYGAGDVGDHLRMRISVIPETNLRVGYMFNPNIRAWVGFDGMYMFNVVRSAGQVASAGAPLQVTVGSTSTIATVNPFAFHFTDSNLPVEGVNFGIEFRF